IDEVITVRDVILITKALADPNRVRILCALRNGELCVCQLLELLGLAPSTVSKHLAILANARLVECRKDGRWAYYRLPGADAAEPVAHAIDWLFESMAMSPVLQRDDHSLEVITRYSPEELCQMQAEGTRCCSSAQETPVAASWRKDGQDCCKGK